MRVFPDWGEEPGQAWKGSDPNTTAPAPLPLLLVLVLPIMPYPLDLELLLAPRVLGTLTWELFNSP